MTDSETEEELGSPVANGLSSVAAELDDPNVTQAEPHDDHHLKPQSPSSMDSTTMRLGSTSRASSFRNSIRRSMSITPPDNLYQAAPPLGIEFLEYTWRIGEILGVPLMLHVTVPIYIACEIFWSICYIGEPGWFLLNTMCVWVFHTMSVAMHVWLTVWASQKMNARIHTAIVWPYGIMGYGYAFKEWIHLVIVLLIGPAVHFIWGLIFVALAAQASDDGKQHWYIERPMSKNFLVNMLNAIWIVNIDIFTFQVSVPIYSMKVARLVATLLSYKRKPERVASVLIFPTAFMIILTAIWAYTDDHRVVGYFLSAWAAYQTFLLYQGQKIGLVHKLPIFQLVQGKLRAESERRERRKRGSGKGKKKRSGGKKSQSSGRDNKQEMLMSEEVNLDGSDEKEEIDDDGVTPMPPPHDSDEVIMGSVKPTHADTVEAAEVVGSDQPTVVEVEKDMEQAGEYRSPGPVGVENDPDQSKEL